MCGLTRDRTSKFGILGQGSNQPSRQARAMWHFLKSCNTSQRAVMLLLYILNHEYQGLLGKFRHGSHFPSSLSVTPLVFTAFSLTSPGFLWDGFGLTSFLGHEGNQPMAVLSLYWDQPDGRDVPSPDSHSLLVPMGVPKAVDASGWDRTPSCPWQARTVSLN